MICGQCNAFSGHLTERLYPAQPLLDSITMTQDFCTDLVNACTDQGMIDFPGYTVDGEDLTYCERHAGTQEGDLYWSLPFVEGELYYVITV